VKDVTSRLLARGGRALGTAAIAHARGQRAQKGPWHVLSRDLAAAAEQILGELEADVPPGALAAAVGAAMGEMPATSEPFWTAPLVHDPEAFARVGRAAAASWPAGFPMEAPADDRERGVVMVALALCRSVDAARALAAKLGAEDGRTLVRAARLCQTLARPGEPSAMRAAVRNSLEPGGTVGDRD
jgi:hypothetical protein